MPQNTSKPPKFSKKNFKKFFLKICTIQNFLKFIFVFRRPKSIRKKYFQASRKNLLDSVIRLYSGDVFLPTKCITVSKYRPLIP